MKGEVLEIKFSNGVAQPSNSSEVLEMATVQQWLAARGFAVVTREVVDQYATEMDCDIDWSDLTCPLLTRR